MSGKSNLVGRVFGEWEVIARGERSSARHSRWVCVCSCGREKVVYEANLRNGKSLGCIKCAAKKRGEARKLDPEWAYLYPTYHTMLTRCYNQKARGWRFYGALGVTVCAEWRGRGGFNNFIADMGHRPPGFTLDRINPSGNYEGANCRWADQKTQSGNKRKNYPKEGIVDANASAEAATDSENYPGGVKIVG